MPVELLRYTDLPQAEIRHTFKNVSWKSLAMVVLVMAAITGYTAIPKGEPTSPTYIAIPGLVTLLFSVLLLLRLFQCRSPRNWLVKLTETGVYVNLQSEITTPAATGAAEVLFIPREMVERVTRVRELRILPHRGGQYKTHYAYFDIAVNEPLPESLLLALARIRRNPKLRGGTGIRRDFHSPVRIENAQTLRLVWDWMTPREDDAAKLFAVEYTLGPRRKFNGPTWSTLSPEEKDRYIDTLWEWGHVEDAVHLSTLVRNTSARTAARYLANRLG
ncbi:MAG: hypothetical protein IT368_13205 [Candidatus Hydrogenedentes bacterium]|nr:hypothetical protein [Candidatus Hydrogenedentota bacterium]